jgi:hypothetical protein
MDYKFYYNSLDFYRDIEKLIPELNLNKTLRLLDQGFFLGEEYQPTPLINLALGRMNELIGEEVFCTKKSIVVNEQYTIFLPIGKERFEQLLNKETVKEVVVVAPVETEEKVEAVTPNWEWIESLANNKADKEALDVYALEEFDIKLNRTKTLANMIKSFKKEL